MCCLAGLLPTMWPRAASALCGLLLNDSPASQPASSLTSLALASHTSKLGHCMPGAAVLLIAGSIPVASVV